MQRGSRVHFVGVAGIGMSGLASVLASQGYVEVPVRARPRVAVVTSGDELCVPGSKLTTGQIYDSNTPGLLAALTAG